MVMALNKMPALSDYGTIIAQFLPFVVLIVVFYFFLIRPQRKRDKQERDMRNSIEIGDEISHHRWFYRPRCQHQGRRSGHRVFERPHEAQDLPLGDPR